MTVTITIPSRDRGRGLRRPPAIAVAGTLVCSLAAWTTFGVLAVTADASSPRVGVLPGWWVPLTVAAGLTAVASWKGWPSRAWWPTLIPALLLLPWLPGQIPAAFLLWTGPIAALVWAATGASIVAAVWHPCAGDAGAGHSSLSRWLCEPRRAAWSAFAAALVLYGVTAWTSSSARPAGDEPNYLIITQSLLLDGDLQIENNHKREDYLAYYLQNLPPDYLRRGKNGQIYSVHAPGLPVLVAPAFALGGYPAVVMLLVIVSAFGAWLVWRTAFALTEHVAAAWFGWAAVCLSVPVLCHAPAVFPDGPGGVLVMTGVAALLKLEKRPRAGTSPGISRRIAAWFLHGAALAVLPWLHTRFAAAAGILGACIALRLIGRRRIKELTAFVGAPILSALAWFVFFYAVYGSFDPSSPYGSYSDSSLSNLWRGLPALFLDQQYGLLPNAPVYGICLAGLAMLLRSRTRLGIELGVLLLVYLAAVASYSMWWGGWSAPARFAVPVLLALGPCAAVFWRRRGTTARAGALVALGVSVLAGGALAMAAGGRLMFNARDGIARWLEWLCPVVDLPRALPSFFRASVARAAADAAVWVAVMLAAWTALGLVKRRLSDRPDRLAYLATAGPILFAVAVMVASSVVWGVGHAAPVTPTSAQLRLLSSFDPVARPVGIQLKSLRLRKPADVAGRLRVSVSERRPLGPAAPPLVIREVPAGTYKLLRDPSSSAPRDLEVRVPGSTLPLERCLFESSRDPDCVIHLPVNAREIDVTSSLSPVPGAVSAPPRAVGTRALELQPIDVLAARERPTLLRASAAARHGEFTVFAFDNLVFLERPGLWVTGAVDVSLVLASDAARASVPVLVRNGASQNTVRLRAGHYREDLLLAPREERIVSLPLDARSRAVLLQVHADKGYRPSETDPGSKDERYLGVWIEFTGQR